MAKNFAEIAFSDVAKKMQEHFGSRASYSKMERDTYQDGLSESEVDFILQRDSFYLASIGSSGFPYIQHRGGPKGFIKILDNKRIGFLDFTGNRQYISVGNIAEENKVALIFMDYPARTRLKIYAKAEIVELNSDPELLKKLDLTEYKFKPERIIILHVEAYDWNCPQHIIARYSEAEIAQAFESERVYVDSLEKENIKLRDELNKLKSNIK